ncbi:tRNA methyltransferase 10 homolog C-like [Saccostrea echinata]|uniref:tRNA methyltransferase 10 homolog C-like n=1 Tax=Saccostrea echinata TaxID=191078 RepID=UPI002A7F8E05|nr:tRNA methyltransferase 10 homolog C-like [Saccostrea echinata]
MSSIKLLGRYFRKLSEANCYRKQDQWNRMFSSPSQSVNGKPVFYPTDQIKNLEDFERFASPEEKEQLQKIQSEYQTLRRMGKLEIELSDQQWLILMNLDSVKSRRKKFKIFQMRQRETTREREYKEKEEFVPDNTGFYKRLYTTTEKMLVRSRVAQAMMLEDPILIDLGLTESLVYTEILEVANKIQLLVASINASAFEVSPTLNIILCNVKPSLEENEVLKILRMKYMAKNARLEDLPFSLVTEKSYLELFPREDLTYLSGDARKYYYPGEDGIPIIGAVVDQKHSESCKLSFSKAFKDDIKIRRLPFEFDKTRRKPLRLSLNQIVEYVAKLNFTCDPVQAGSVLPTKIIKNDDDIEDNGHD